MPPLATSDLAWRGLGRARERALHNQTARSRAGLGDRRTLIATSRLSRLSPGIATPDQHLLTGAAFPRISVDTSVGASFSTVRQTLCISALEAISPSRADEP